MAQSDFLADGQPVPEGSAFKSLTSQTVLPDWYTNYAMQLLSNQQAVGAQPYQTYQGPRVAGFNPTQQAGFAQTQQAAGAYQPFLTSASNLATAATGAGMGGLPAAQSYYNTASSMNPSATAAPGFNAARGGLAAATNFNPAAAASGDFGAARGGLDTAAGFNPAAAASPFIGQATGMNGLTAAMPWLSAAGGTVEDVTSYMNPYEQQVVDYIGEQGARNLRENIMPALEGRYIAAGQFGDVATGGQASGFLTDTARAIRDTSRDILGQQSQLRQSGYLSAQGAKAGDLSRQAGIGSTIGGLTQAQQNILMGAGNAMGGFEQARQAALLDIARQRTGIGTTLGGFEQAQQAAALQAAQQQADIAAREAALVGNQQQLLANIGTSAGGLAAADANRMLTGAGTLANIGGLSQTYGLAGADALGAIGKQQQTLDQTNLDVAYADYLRQQGYPQEQINAALATLKGVAPGVPTASTEQGIVPTGQTNQYSPSTAAKIAAGLTGGAALVDSLGKIF